MSRSKSERPRSYFRAQRRRVIDRKKRIIHEQNDYWVYRHEGVLSKSKIHCSCPLCRHKSYDYATANDIRKSERAIGDCMDQELLTRPLAAVIAHEKRRVRVAW